MAEVFAFAVRIYWVCGKNNMLCDRCLINVLGRRPRRTHRVQVTLWFRLVPGGRVGIRREGKERPPGEGVGAGERGVEPAPLFIMHRCGDIG